MTKNILIIGAGLTGLKIAHQLQQEGRSFQILEARNRIGGRILTKVTAEGTPIEMGATWLGHQHVHLLELLKELEVDIFEQRTNGTALFEPFSMAAPQAYPLPPNQIPSYRIAGGSEALINRLAETLPTDRIQLEEPVLQITDRGEYLEVVTTKTKYRAHQVVSTLPPLLFIKSIEVSPELPKNLLEVCLRTHIWMGDSIKFGLSFARPFWRDRELSGMVFSNVGPITEMYDHSNRAENRFALMGFLNGGLANESRAYREEQVLKQLQKFFGEEVLSYTAYEEVVWREELHTFVAADDFLLPHQNNGHSVFQQSYLGHKLFLAGAETGIPHGGYMDGAVQSAAQCLAQLALAR